MAERQAQGSEGTPDRRMLRRSSPPVAGSLEPLVARLVGTRDPFVLRPTTSATRSQARKRIIPYPYVNDPARYGIACAVVSRES